ncbi:FACT complex subunit Ssrp1 [Wyeomyia smithii]|uniref:FACT complex subunit Ssrp1 n=1 Tax=Wyeomyia smithii TaxID=174621 RepID=UPI002467D77E|nr:FACT complex subunit Ssrp1 [Wyeomyia smithii]XP_055535590.1 FACT complex subunit Ssrp1 [Wyeomyia smithii]
MDFLEYSSISSEVRGAMCPGKLKMTDTAIVFKNEKTGKVEQINAADIDLLNYQRCIGSFGLRVFMKNGTLHRFLGFTGDEKKIADFVKKNYKMDMLEKELSTRGWNWGTVHFKGAVLSFDVENKTSFEIPLNHVSQCNAGKNEVTVEFHRNDDAPVSLMEMRFHIPTLESAETDPVEAFQEQVMKQASVISASGDAIAIFREIHCLTPRGRYDIKVFQSFFQLHGKTYDFKIPTSSVLRLFLLPHKDNRQMFFVISLDPPIKQGQTRYHFLVTLFQMDEETNIELPFTEEELKEKYEDRLTKELSGPVYEVLGKIMKVIINRKLTGPGTFIGNTGTPAIGCSYKAAAGYIYPLERGFIYVHKPPVHIRFEEIASVNFARSGGSTRSFDFEIELKTGTIYTFSSIEKEEYGKLFDFISSKKLHVKNTGKDGKNNYKEDFADSDNEGEPDAYLARVKAEAKERDDDGDDDDSEESTDEDFNPNQAESDVADEFDSNVESTSEDDSEDGGGGSGDSGKAKKEKKKDKKEKKERKERKEKRTKKSKTGGPKRPATAFMMWLNATRDKIRKDNPGISITEIAKKGGEMWKELKDKTEWEQKAAKAKEEYSEALKAYKAAGGGASGEEGEKGASAKRKKDGVSPKKAASAASMTGSGFKSKEYISGDDSSSDNEDGEKKNPKKAKKSRPEEEKSDKKKDDKKKDDEKKAKKSGSESEASANESAEEEEEDEEDGDSN